MWAGEDDELIFPVRETFPMRIGARHVCDEFLAPVFAFDQKRQMGDERRAVDYSCQVAPTGRLDKVDLLLPVGDGEVLRHIHALSPRAKVERGELL